MLSPSCWRILFRTTIKTIPPRLVCQVRCASSSTELPSQIENSRSNLSRSLTARIDKLQTSILFAGKRLNDLTGYSGIERLKKQIEEQESAVLTSVQKVKEAKKSYEESIRTRSESQREVNELLQRKSYWSPSDLERFTTLFRNDHSNSQNEEASQKALADAEIYADQCRTDLGNMILARYHEEQIWSDKIRRASTWGTWGLMGFNIFLFIIVQLGLEPWKRKRLVGSFEEKVRQVVQEERAALVSERELSSATTTGFGGSATGEGDSEFMTDADYASAAYDHEGVRVGFQAPAVQEMAMTPSGSLREDLPIDSSTMLVADPTDLQNSFEETERADELLTAPRAGTSSMLLTPISLHHIRTSALILFSKLRIGFWLVSDRLLRVWRAALSGERSHLRVEDVTSVCFASGALGIAIGMGISR